MKGKVSSFELGVGRLLHMLGIPVALYSDGAEEARPDAEGYTCDFRATWIIILLKVFVTKWVVLHIRP
jgi:hypothetical protein